MRGFKRDQPATLLRGCADKRSFVSQPKIIEGECTEAKPHLILYGKDKGPVRAEIFKRNRDKDGHNHCWKCGKRVHEHVHEDLTVYFGGEWHHLRNKPGTRCDCPENGVVSCQACHLPEHPQTQFGRHKELA